MKKQKTPPAPPLPKIALEEVELGNKVEEMRCIDTQSADDKSVGNFLLQAEWQIDMARSSLKKEVISKDAKKEMLEALLTLKIQLIKARELLEIEKESATKIKGFN